MRRPRDLPPSRAEALLRRLAPGRSAGYVIADLGEEYRDRRARSPRLGCDLWYWTHAARLGLRFVVHRIRGGSPVLPRHEPIGMIDPLRQDVRFAVRTLVASRSFALVAVAALAIGIGANTAIFSVVYGVLQALPYPGGERVVLAYEGDADHRDNRMVLSPPEVLALDELEGEVFDIVSYYRYASLTMEGEPNAEVINAPHLSADFLALVDTTPVLGRGFHEADSAESRVLMLGHELWQRRFGGRDDIVGQEVRFGGEAYTVIGVTSPDFTYFNNTDLVYLPLTFGIEERSDPRQHNVLALARLRAGIDAETAERRIAGAVQAAQVAVGHRTDVPHDVWLHSLYDAWVGQVRAPLLLLMGAVGVLVLIACSNVASLQLARGLGRGREIAIRLSLGAGRGRVVRQLLTESVLLSIASGAVGLLVATLTVGSLRRLVEAQLPRTENVQIDLAVLGFTAALAIAASVLSGLAPAWIATRSDLTRPLAEGSAAVAGGRGARRARAGLLIVQVALAVVLAVGAGLLVRSFNQLRARDLGYEPENVVTAGVLFGMRPEYRDPEVVRGAVERLLDRVRSLPGVESAGAMNMPPGFAAAMRNEFVTETAEPTAAPTVAGLGVVTPGALETLGVRLRQGRSFSAADRADAPPVALVNEAMARRLWPDGDALGGRIEEAARAADPQWATIVGVVGDVRQTPLTEPDEPRVYRPLAQRSQTFLSVVVRLSGPIDGFAESFRQAVGEIDPGVPVSGPSALDGLLASRVATDRVNTALVSLFAVLALVLAALGEYAVIQYMVVQRSSEIGVRMALGAGRSRVVSMVLRQGLLLAALGVGLGIVGAWGASRWIASLLHDVAPTDPLTYTGVALLLLGVATFASLVPARRASRIDPVTTLRRG